MVRAAIAAERRRAGLRRSTGGGGAACARRRSEPERGARRSAGFARGLGASLLLATGYVALVSALRALLAAT
jgi:hypothetical protein